MKPIRKEATIVLISFALVFQTITFSQAEIYKFKKDGVWTYTDTPPAELPADSKVIPDSGSRSASSGSGRPLLAGFPARTPIEKATAATVAVQSPLGFGSGFFVSRNGYLITNKHVIRTTEANSARSEDYFEDKTRRFDQIEKQLADETRRMENFKTRLDKLKKAADAETQPQRKQAYLEDYRKNLETLQEWTDAHQKRQRAFEESKRRFQADRSNYDYYKVVGDLARSFTIFLADNQQHYVRLVAVSDRYDLALLKLDGYQVPILTPADARSMVQGDRLYAIGSPVKLKNSVTSGVFSGFEQGYIQTDTRIYPGNSGGPLVDADGRVVGINTFKKLTRKFEGLGFAIPIQTALQEFKSYF
jgi:serine protease Do